MTKRGVFLLLPALLWVPACESGAGTPEEAFRACVRHVREGRYDEVWGLLSENLRRKWAAGVERQRAILRSGGPSRKALENMIRQQYRSSPEEFLVLSPRELYARNLEFRKDWIARWKLQGPARISGDKATLEVLTDPGAAPWTWTLVRRGGSWTIDGAPLGESRR